MEADGMSCGEKSITEVKNYRAPAASPERTMLLRLLNIFSFFREGVKRSNVFLTPIKLDTSLLFFGGHFLFFFSLDFGESFLAGRWILSIAEVLCYNRHLPRNFLLLCFCSVELDIAPKYIIKKTILDKMLVKRKSTISCLNILLLCKLRSRLNATVLLLKII